MLLEQGPIETIGEALPEEILLAPSSSMTSPTERISGEPAPEEQIPDESAPGERVSGEPAPVERVSDEFTREEWVAELVTLTVEGRNQMDRIETQLEALISWPERLERRLAETKIETVALREELENLRRELKRIGRHQFKANTLDETRLERWQEAVKALESALVRREGEVASMRLQQRQAIEAARREWLVTLLPLLDGLEDALASGERQITWLKGKRTAWEMEQSQRQGMLDRLRRVWRGGGPALDRETIAALSGWLDGLRLLRDRAWTLLKDAGVQTIPTVGQTFDPHFHVAVGTAEREDVPHGLILAEQRCGYRLNNNVLRFAEVVVARRPVAPEAANQRD